MKKGFVYILECCDRSYYTGSTIDLAKRFKEHVAGTGANYTRERLPVKLVYVEEFVRIELAFEREKQIQGWSRRKKSALIESRKLDLPDLSKNYSENGSIEERIESGKLPNGM